jgi:YD repeat-containing protein
MITADGGSTETDMYDAFGRLASRTNSAGSFKYFYDLAGNVALTQTASGTVVQPETYIAGRHFGSIISGNTVFLQTDWLGTGRWWTTLSGANYRTCDSSGRQGAQ